MLNDSTEKAINIIKELLLGNSVSDLENKDLKDIYRLESSVANDIDEILDIFDLDLFEGHEGELFISPRVENMIFGYKNEEMKSMLKVEKNIELYMCYFIIYCLLTMFYKDDTGRTGRTYLTVDALKDEVDLRFELLKGSLDNEKISVEELDNMEGCQAILNTWLNGTVDSNTKSAVVNEKDTKSKTKIGYCNRVLSFFENQDLLFCDKITFKYSPTERFRTIVVHAYTNSSYNYIGLLNRKLNEQYVENTGESLNSRPIGYTNNYMADNEVATTNIEDTK